MGKLYLGTAIPQRKPKLMYLLEYREILSRNNNMRYVLRQSSMVAMITS